MSQKACEAVFTHNNRSSETEGDVKCLTFQCLFRCLTLLHRMLLGSSLALPPISQLMVRNTFHGPTFIPAQLALETRLKRTSGETWINRNRRISLSLSASFFPSLYPSLSLSLCLFPPSLGCSLMLLLPLPVQVLVNLLSALSQLSWRKSINLFGGFP